MTQAAGIEVVLYRSEWSAQFKQLVDVLVPALAGLPATVERVGSTSVPGLAAKPVLDIDVVVPPGHVKQAVAALESLGYQHRGDLGVTGREAFTAPDDTPRRRVYVCPSGNIHLRNHLAVRDVLRRRDDLRDEYAAVKLALAADPDMDIDTYLAGKSTVLQEILSQSGLTEAEREEIWRLNDPSR